MLIETKLWLAGAFLVYPWSIERIGEAKLR
jgi:hypothetical protein